MDNSASRLRLPHLAALLAAALAVATTALLTLPTVVSKIKCCCCHFIQPVLLSDSRLQQLCQLQCLLQSSQVRPSSVAGAATTHYCVSRCHDGTAPGAATQQHGAMWVSKQQLRPMLAGATHTKVAEASVTCCWRHCGLRCIP